MIEEVHRACLDYMTAIGRLFRSKHRIELGVEKVVFRKGDTPAVFSTQYASRGERQS